MTSPYKFLALVHLVTSSIILVIPSVAHRAPLWSSLKKTPQNKQKKPQNQSLGIRKLLSVVSAEPWEYS